MPPSQSYMPPSQSYIPPVSPQAPIHVLTTSMLVSDPAGLGTIVPLAQQTQPPATPMQLTDIIPQAAPQQTQPVMIPQQTIVQQQQIGMDPQTSALQQPQQQMEAQATVLEQQQVSATQPPPEQQQSLQATAVQQLHHEPQQRIYAQQPIPPVQPTTHEQVLQTQKHQIYLQQQLDQHQQALLQRQQLIQQQQPPQQALLQQHVEQQPPSQQQSHLYQQIGQHQVGSQAGTEVIQPQTQTISQAQVPMAIQTTQIPLQTSAVAPAPVFTQQGQSEAPPQNQGQVPVHYISQSTAQAAQAMTEARVPPLAAMIQGQTQIIQTQQIPLQTSYPGSVSSSQDQVTAQKLVQTQPLHQTISQSQPQHGQGPTVDIQMMGQLSQAALQPPAAVASVPSQIQHESLVQQNAQMPGLMQPQLQQQTQDHPPGQVNAPAGAGPLTPQYVTQLTHQAMPSVQQDIAHITQQQQQQQPVLQYPQIIPSPGSAGVGTKTDASSIEPANFVAAPHAVQQAGQAYVQAQQQPLGSATDPSVIQPISQPALPQSTEQYQQQLQKLPQVHQPPSPPPPKAQLLAQPIATPIQQPVSENQVLMPLDESQRPPQFPPDSHLGTHPPAQIVTTPLYRYPVTGTIPSPQRLANQMLPLHMHTQTSIQAQAQSQTQTQIQTQVQSHTQKNIETGIAEQTVVPNVVFPAQQMPLSPSHTSCPPTTLPSLPSHHPAAAPAPELPSSPLTAQVTLPRQVNFVPTSPPPVATLQLLDFNTPKLSQASLQDCDLSLLCIAQVPEKWKFTVLFKKSFYYFRMNDNTAI